MINRIVLLVFPAVLAAGASQAQTAAPTKQVPPLSPKASLLDDRTRTPRPIGAFPQLLKWRGGSNIELCVPTATDNLSVGGISCLRRPMPKVTGKPRAVIEGPFMDPKVAAASWIVVSDKRYSLCYLTSRSKVQRTVCRPIKAPVVAKARIAVRNLYGLNIMTVDVAPETIGNDKASRTKFKRSMLAFRNALTSAQVASTKNAVKRYSGRLIPQSSMVDAGGAGGCYFDDWGSFCDGGGGDGGGYFPDDPGNGGDDSGNGGNDNSGGYPDYPDGSGGDESLPMSDDGGADTGSGGSSPAIPFPPGSEPNNSGGTTTCVVTPVGMICTTTAPRPGPMADPFEPPLPSGPPPSEPTGNWWCNIPIIGGWLCGGSMPPLPEPPSGPPPSETPPKVADPWWPKPTAPEDGRPWAKYRDGYEEARQQCDADRSSDEGVCSNGYVMRGGPIYKDKQDRGETLTAEDRKWLKEANTFYSSCMSKAGAAWDVCNRQAMDDYRENGSGQMPLKAGNRK